MIAATELLLIVLWLLGPGTWVALIAFLIYLHVNHPPARHRAVREPPWRRRGPTKGSKS